LACWQDKAMKYRVLIERVVKETIEYHFDRASSLEALDTSLDYCEKLNRSTYDQSGNIKTTYHLVKVEADNDQEEQELPWCAGAIGRIPQDDALVYREDAMTGLSFYALNANEAEIAAQYLNDLEKRLC
jgi:hypothetical protein